MNIYVLRHGQTDLNLQNRFQGRIDIELNKIGIEQVEKTKKDLEKINFDLVFVSPLKRAITTAKIVTNNILIKDERIIERSFGKLEGKLGINDYEEKSEYYEIESIEQLKKRVYNFLTEITSKYSEKENILIVTHEAVAQVINSYFNKIDNIKTFRLATGQYTMYKYINKEQLMRYLEHTEISRKILDLEPQKLKKGNSNKDKIHIVYLMAWTKVCGGSKIILEYANRLANKGHTITLISYDVPPHWFKLDNKVKFVQVPENELMEDYIPVCDIIVATSWKNIYQAINSKKAPVTFFEQGGAHVFGVESLPKEKYNAVKERIKLLQFIHTVSSYSKNQIKKYYGKDSKVICNAVENKIFYPRKNYEACSDKINVTIIGSEGFKFKNINETLEVVRDLKRKYNHLQLNWISQDKPILNKEKAIINPKQEEIGEILRSTDIFICNSEYESFCLPALEAMSCGAAVITTDNGGIRDFIVDNFNALIIKKHDKQDMLKKIETLIEDQEKRKEIMKNGIESSKKFNWEESVNQMEKYYKDIAQYEVIK